MVLLVTHIVRFQCLGNAGISVLIVYSGFNCVTEYNEVLILKFWIIYKSGV